MTHAGEIDESIWGPPPSREEVLEALGHNDVLTRKLIAYTLELCATHDHVSYRMGLSFEELRRQANEREIVNVNLDGIHYFFPTWQFQESEDGSWTVHPQALQAWEAWRKDLDPLGFFRFMVEPEDGHDRPRIDVLVEGTDDQAIREIYNRIPDHGINYM